METEGSTTPEPAVSESSEVSTQQSEPQTMREKTDAALNKAYDMLMSEQKDEPKPTGKEEKNGLREQKEGQEEAQEVEEEKEAKTEESEEQEPDDTKEAEGEAKEDKPKRRRVAPPKHFTAEEKELFDAQPEELKTLWKGREKELGGRLNALHTENLQHKEEIESYKQYDEVLKLADKEARMLTSLIKSQGGQGETSPAQLIKNLIDFHALSLEKPLEAIQVLARNTGVDLREMINGDVNLAYDRQLNDYKRVLARQQAEIDAMKSQQEQVQQQTQQQYQQQQLQQAQARVAPLYAEIPQEYRQEVDMMAGVRFEALVRANPQGNVSQMLERAVTDAAYSIPELREQKLAEQQEAQAAARARRVQESKQMAFSPSSKSPAAKFKGKRTTQEILSQKYDELAQQGLI